MSKFIQFNTAFTPGVQPLGPRESVLLNIEDIQSYAATGAAGAANTLVIQTLGRAAGLAGTAGFQTLTLTFATNIAGAVVAPLLVDGQPNPFTEAMKAALSQDVPDSVVVYQLGNDQSTAAAAPNGVQMYIRSAVLT